MPSLRIKLPDNKGEITHVLAGDRITVGRRPENTIQIIDRSVSGHHAEIIGYHGQYRVRDLGSTNLTTVDGHAVTDSQLNKDCKIKFGSVECDFTLESAAPAAGPKGESAPTKSEMEFLRRENLDLQAKIAAQQKQIDILSSARLMTKETQQLGVAPEAHRRMSAERDQLRTENGELKASLANLREGLETMMRERDAIRQAWQTVKTELEAAEKELAALRPAPAAPTVVSEAVVEPASTFDPSHDHATAESGVHAHH